MSPEQEIRRRISNHGPITLAEFIEIVLYWPQGGFYVSRNPVGGDGGDFYTSPLAHPIFGALLAVQLFQMWQIMERPAPFTVIERGAGNGLLARDIVSFASGLPDGFVDSLQYIPVDRWPTSGLGPRSVRSLRIASTGLPFRPVQGCMLSNEFLDACPVHQIVATPDGLKEVYVALENGELVTQTHDTSTPELAARFETLGITLQEGQTAEVNLGLDTWAQETAAALERGFVLTVDYGHTAAELYSPRHRFRGTLTTYRQHLQTDAPLQAIGEQDITAQVDFTSLVKAGRGAGLDPMGFALQRDFLHHLNLSHFIDQLKGRRGNQRDIQAARSGIMELVKPGGLGDFRVLAQGKNVGQPNLWGFKYDPANHMLVAGLELPDLTPEHLNLAQGRYPGLDTALDTFWPSEKPTGPG